MGLLSIYFPNIIAYPGSLSERTDTHLVMCRGVGNTSQGNFKSGAGLGLGRDEWALCLQPKI